MLKYRVPFQSFNRLLSTVWFQRFSGPLQSAVFTSKACASLSRKVSNRDMRRMILSLWILLLTVCLWSQTPSTNKTEKAAIRRAKSLVVSSFDRSLPNVSLEFFLKSEGGGAPIKWEVKDCGEQNGNSATDDRRTPPMCVEADFEAKNLTAVTVLVSVGTLKGGHRELGVPAFLRVTITDLSGTSSPVRHLGDLPMELHRPAPRLPRDLPDPVGALSSVPNHGRIVSLRQACGSVEKWR